jgi:hypothetical protein
MSLYKDKIFIFILYIYKKINHTSIVIRKCLFDYVKARVRGSWSLKVSNINSKNNKTWRQ